MRAITMNTNEQEIGKAAISGAELLAELAEASTLGDEFRPMEAKEGAEEAEELAFGAVLFMLDMVAADERARAETPGGRGGGKRGKQEAAKAQAVACELGPRIAEGRSAGETFKTITEGLNADGIPAPNGGPWSEPVVRDVHHRFLQGDREALDAAHEAVLDRSTAYGPLAEFSARRAAEFRGVMEPRITGLHGQGFGDRAITRIFNLLRIRPARGKKWSPFSVSRMRVSMPKGGKN